MLTQVVKCLRNNDDFQSLHQIVPTMPLSAPDVSPTENDANNSSYHRSIVDFLFKTENKYFQIRCLNDC